MNISDLFGFLQITGIIIMAIGLTVQGAYHNFREILDPQFFSVPTFLVVIGSFIFIIAFFGCCGAYKENYCMTLTVRFLHTLCSSVPWKTNDIFFLKQFSILLVFIFILELAAGISGYVLRNDTYRLVTSTLQSSMTKYGGNTSNEITFLWDEIQVDVCMSWGTCLKTVLIVVLFSNKIQFDCCGVNSSNDWGETNKQLFNETFLPMTCCRTTTGKLVPWTLYYN